MHLGLSGGFVHRVGRIDPSRLIRKQRARPRILVSRYSRPTYGNGPDKSRGNLMSELTTTTPAATVDEGARFRAFTALGLALVALMDGGVVANGLQWLLLDRFSASPGDPSYALALGGVPVAMSMVALWLASNTTSSTDSLARPLARSSQVLSALAILGAVVLTIAVLTQP